MSGSIQLIERGKDAHFDMLIDAARGYLSGGKISAAKHAIDQATEIDSRDFRVLFTEARTLKRRGKYKEAIELLEKLKSRDLKGIATLEIGHVYMTEAYNSLKNDNKDHSVERMQQAVRRFTELEETECESTAFLEIARAQTMIGRIEKSRGNKEKAAAYFRQAGRFLDECNVGYLVTPAQLEYARAQLESALDNYDEAYRLFILVKTLPQFSGERTRELANNAINQLISENLITKSVERQEASKDESSIGYKLQKLLEVNTTNHNNRGKK